MFYSRTSDFEIIAKCRRASGNAVSSVVSSWQRLGGGSWSKGSEKFGGFFTSGGKI